MKKEELSPDFIASDALFVDGDDHTWAVSGFDPKKGTVTLRLVDRPTREMTIEDLRRNYRPFSVVQRKELEELLAKTLHPGKPGAET